MTHQNTFSKFDALGSVLTELSFDVVQMSMFRNKDGSIFYSVFVHGAPGECTHGNGATPSAALQLALKKNVAREAEWQAARVESRALVASNA